MSEVLNRDGSPAEVLTAEVTKYFNGVDVVFEETYYLDYEVNEETGLINKEKKVPHYTKEQTTKNMKALKFALKQKYR